MSRSMFDDLDASHSAQMDTADSRTLRLAAHPLTEAELQGLLRYQEAFLAHVEAAGGEAAALVEAHDKGLAASGLAVKVVELGTAMLRAYAGQRWTARTLRERLASLADRTDEASRERAGKIQGELRRIEDLEPLARRYGQASVDLLGAHEDRLVALHTRMQRTLTRT
ncbi:hypothetical protein [Archangium primigenium]|uniref:hypothetical protein n=1 Tax=[Archangium] primigenium TaxID=2792470 RepID=UPI00195EA3A8|nr:hypothetical protein [Archangium primigenium]MBM7116350.1 hypothetical protein [Archangium primigenium]